MRGTRKHQKYLKRQAKLVKRVTTRPSTKNQTDTRPKHRLFRRQARSFIPAWLARALAGRGKLG